MRFCTDPKLAHHYGMPVNKTLAFNIGAIA
jgi:hypothetical protein